MHRLIDVDMNDVPFRIAVVMELAMLSWAILPQCRLLRADRQTDAAWLCAVSFDTMRSPFGGREQQIKSN